MGETLRVGAQPRWVDMLVAVGIACLFLVLVASRIEAPVTSSELRWSAPFGEGEASITGVMEMGVLTTEYRPEPDGVWIGDAESFWSLAPTPGTHDSLILSFVAPEWLSAAAELVVRAVPARLASPLANDPVLATVQIEPGTSGVLSVDLTATPVSDGQVFLSMTCSPAEYPPGGADMRTLCAKLVRIQLVTEAIP
jgi:hypothetical protein